MMISGRLLSLFILPLVLVGCSGDGSSTLSSRLQNSSPLKAAYKSTDIIPIRWKAPEGDSAPEYLILEISSDDGVTWSEVESHLENDGEYDWDISELPHTVYRVKLTSVAGGIRETIDLGRFLIDDEAPVIGADQTISYIEDHVAAFTLSAPSDNDQYTLDFVTTPTRGVLTGCAQGSSSLSCVYTPNQDNDIDDSFSYKVVDRAGNESAIATVNLVVQPENDAPVIQTLACPNKIGENYNYSCVISAVDPDLPSPLTLLYQFDTGTNCGAWLSIDDTTGEVSGTPSAAEVGTTCHVAVFAEDDVGAKSATFEWDITVENSAPIINVTGGPYSVMEDSALAVVIPGANVSSIEEGGSTYSLVAPVVSGDFCADVAESPASTNLTIDAVTGEVSFRPKADYQGVCHIRIALTDSFPSTGYADVAITVINTQDLPKVATALSPCISSLKQDEPYSCTIAVTDPDPEILTITRDGTDTCSWITTTPSADGRSVVVSGTPTDDDVGTCTLAVRATDTLSATDMESLSITVENIAPTLTIATPKELLEDDPLFASSPAEVLSNAQVVSSDEGYGVYSLDFSSLSGVACNDSSVVATPATDFLIDATTGAVSIKPLANYFGSCFAKIQFDDGNGDPDSVISQEIEIKIKSVNDAPQFTSIPTFHEVFLAPGANKSDAIVFDYTVGPANEQSQTVQMICTNSNTSRLTVDCSATQTGDGTLSIGLTATPGADTSAVVTVKLRDSGNGTNESVVATINVNLTDSIELAAITSDTTNYNMYDAAMNEYGSMILSSSSTFVVRIASGVKVYSTDPSLPALRTGSLPASARIRIINEGMIVGAAGAGGDSSTSAVGSARMGQHGGTAIKIDDFFAKTTISNSGMIYGGGGGGGRGGTDNSDGSFAAGGSGASALAAATAGEEGLNGDVGGDPATEIGGGATSASNYTPANGHAQTSGVAGQGGNSCLTGLSFGNNLNEAFFGRGGFGAGFGGGAGGCSSTFAGGGGGGHFGGGGGSGGLSDTGDSGNLNTDVNGYNGGNGGAAIEVPSTVISPADINITINSSDSAQIAGCVWNDISGVYLTSIANDSDVDSRELTFTSTASQNVNAPTGLKVWNNGRGKAYR